MAVVTVTKKRKMDFLKSRYVRCSGLGCFFGSFSFLTDLLCFFSQCEPEGRGAPLAPHKALKSGALSSPDEVGQMA
jgi:hypothetical protein